MSKSYDTLVIGGGHNGLTAASTLALRGQRVLLLERSASLGGRIARQEFAPGYSSPALLHDTRGISRSIVEELSLERYGLQLVPSPPVFAPQSDGPGLLLHHDPTQAASELSAEDAKAYGAYRKHLDAIGPFIRGLLDQPPPPLMQEREDDGIWPLLRAGFDLRRLGKKRMMELLRSAPLCSDDWLSEWFASPLLKAVLAGPAHYGSYTGPRSPASNTALLLHECSGHESVKGGVFALLDALIGCATQSRVEMRTNAEVTRILLDDQRQKITGVRLASGEEIQAKRIAASCDPKQLFLKLFRPFDLPSQLEQRMLHFRARGTTAKMHLALNRAPRFACRPEHPIEFARTGEHPLDIERAFDAVKYRRFSDAPALDIHVPTTSDPSLAPEGHHVMSVLIHFAPYDLDAGWDDAQTEALGEAALSSLERYIPDLRDAIVAKQVLNPQHIEARFGLTGGHIYHGEMALDQLLIRPIPECARYHTPIEGLYLCGSGAHPGGGITCRPGYLSGSSVT